MKDINEKTIKIGDVVKIEGGYFKSDNGLFYVTRAEGDEKSVTLRKIRKDGTPSNAKYNVAFFPLMVTTNSREKKAAAKTWNAEHATIEIINGRISRTAIIAELREKAQEEENNAEYGKKNGWSENVIKEMTARANYYKAEADRIEAEENKNTESDSAKNEENSFNNFVPDNRSAEQDEINNTKSTHHDNDYFMENKETGKLELYFDRETYAALKDSTKKEIKSNFLWARSKSAWVSRCKFPNLYRAREIAQNIGLVDAGITGERLTFEQQQEAKAERAEIRAQRYEAKAEKSRRAGEILQKPINNMHGDIAFFTQPNINTTAGRAFTRRREKMFAAFEKGFEEFKKSEYYITRAETARTTAKKPTDKRFCQRRIDEATKEFKAHTKNIDAYNATLEKIKNGEIVKNWRGEVLTIEQLEKMIDRAEELKAGAIEKIIYYSTIIDELGGIVEKSDLNPGDLVKIYRYKEPVKFIKGGAKNFTYEFLQSHMVYADGRQMQGRAAYAEIEHILKE